MSDKEESQCLYCGYQGDPSSHSPGECTKIQMDALRKELFHPVALPEKVLNEGDTICQFLWSNRHPGFMRCRLFAGHTCDHEAMDFSGRYRCTWSGKQEDAGKEELIK